MSSNANYRLPEATLDADRDALRALKDLEDYRPVNPEHSVEALTALDQSLREAEEAEARIQKALAAARETSIRAGRAFHSTMQGAKDQVIAQYGRDSLAIRSIGLTRRSDRRRPIRRGVPQT